MPVGNFAHGPKQIMVSCSFITSQSSVALKLKIMYEFKFGLHL